MTEIAARWRDEVLPHVAWRQWVLTVPFGLRQRMAWDREWLDVVLGEFHRVIQNRFRLLGRKQGVKAGEYAAATAVQRSGGALQVHVHFHVLVAEGIWDGPKFVPLSIKDEDVRAIVAVAAARILRKAVSRGLVEVDEEGVMTLVRPDVEDEQKQQELALLEATAPRPRGGARKEDFRGRRAYHARSSGFDLDAGVRISAKDRTGLEQLSRYLLRGPVASDRLVALPDGRFELTLKRAWRDGTTSFVWTGEELVGRLAALVAPFRQKLVRYHGATGGSRARGAAGG